MVEKPFVSALYLAIADWLKATGIDDATKLPQPVRRELRRGDEILTVQLNASRETITVKDYAGVELDLSPFGLVIYSDKYIAVGLLDPFGGALGGFNEDRLIETFNKAAGKS